MSFKTRIACRESYRWTESTETFRLHETSHVDRLFSVPTRQCWLSFFQSNLFLTMWQLFSSRLQYVQNFFPALCKIKTLLPSGLWGFVGSNECHRIRRGSVEDCLNIYLYRWIFAIFTLVSPAPRMSIEAKWCHLGRILISKMVTTAELSKGKIGNHEEPMRTLKANANKPRGWTAGKRDWLRRDCF